MTINPPIKKGRQPGRSATVYMKPPAPVRKKRAVPQGPWRELQGFLFRYRSQVWPLGLGFWVGGVATALGPYRGGIGTLALAVWYAALTGFLYQDRYEPPTSVPWIRLDRPVEHWYAAGCAAVAGLWSVGATWGATKPSPRAILVLVLLILVCGTPWWHHRRIRGSILVRFDNVRGPERNRKLMEARALVHNWISFVSAAQLSGAKLRGVTFNPWSTNVAVELRQGATLGEFTPRKMEKLESAADGLLAGIRTGGARVDRVSNKARLAVLRFMTSDPHAEPIPVAEYDQGDRDKIIVGLFETGEEVMFSLISTLVAGLTGSGKSVLQNVIIRALARIPWVAIVGIDMKPGAPEFGPWRKVMHAIGTDKATTDNILARLFAGLTYRGAVMQANGTRTWVPTRENPFIVLMVDEVHLLDSKQRKRLDDIVSIIRAYGGCAVVATQYPVKASVSSAIKANCKQRFGFLVADGAGDRVVFGDQATRTGWRPSAMVPTDREGSFLIKSPMYKRPNLARSLFMEDDEVPVYVDRWAPFRTEIDAGTWGQLEAGTPLPAVEEGADPNIVDAEIIPDDDPLETVLNALSVSSKVTELIGLTGFSRATLYRHLRTLKAQGMADDPKRGVWVRTDVSGDD